ncbi:winged helix-turn-helix domain-containing protein [Jiangella rhizosphaerae]|uniref:ArsR family transcriptional regulator n=1 Tax=Jiangella rhizosphaerae TaxID=2293569 RepID=A0A418KUC4_9ACTN|nr:winged helix-turn-helix domain-containing protein [Jiangella rhizosphaerae]RIQ30103.1 ArsR family transcriptional regulator [Jiangella rhizosphaerae]
MAAITYLEEPADVRVALAPPRRELLTHLREPASATQLAAALGLPRQRVNYHLRVLEAAGLVELVEERKRRGCVERILRAKPGAVVVDPAVMSAGDEQARFARLQDQYAAEHLVSVAADTVRDVARMQAKADDAGKRLLTFTIEAEVRFAGPGDVHTFTDDLTEAVRQVVARFDTEGGRPYRMVAGGYPAPRGGDRS